ncbi:coagulation factor X [Ictalurus furcatus]|uniref:coagulation factor X n=1 Tax=Ictalurus furcatus TaxID=66913 RepID=UPI002350D214|nr:coagulation factor X [Ictalurus furcatus]
MFRVFRTFLCLLLVHCVTPEVFLHTKDANQVLTRYRRANSIFEELKKGDMERECVEERCSYEEAREIFEDDRKTNEFWNIYHDGDACISQPCLNKGVCKDGIGRYTCFCPELFQGYNCEIAIPQLCEVKNGGCEHFCKVDQKKGTAVCSCAKGYNLAADRKACTSDAPFKCGHLFPKTTRSILTHHTTENVTNNSNGTSPTRVQVGTNEGKSVTFTKKEVVTNATQSKADTNSLFGLMEPIPTVREEAILPESSGDTRIVNGEDCPPGECPWQALLMNEDKIGFCGGTILNEYFILSAAHCMNLSRSITVILGETDVLVREGREAVHAVEQVLVHTNYQPETYHNDIALIKLVQPITFTKYILPACLPDRDFAERVLMQQEEGMVSGFGRLHEGGLQATTLQKLTVPYVDRSICKESTKFNISPRMFCAGYAKEEKDACQGDSGGPHVTRFKNTWFVTGVVSWGEGCARKNKYGIYTQVSKYLKWIETVMDQVIAETKTGKNSKKKRRAPGQVPVIRM